MQGGMKAVSQWTGGTRPLTTRCTSPRNEAPLAATAAADDPPRTSDDNLFILAIVSLTWASSKRRLWPLSRRTYVAAYV